MSTAYDSSWDEGNSDLWHQKHEEWQERDWESWLTDYLSFPFEVRRKEDDDDAYFSDAAQQGPFRVGHVMSALAIDEDPRCEILVEVREGKKTGHVPLCDVEVTPKTDPNYWPVREFVVWFANR